MATEPEKRAANRAARQRLIDDLNGDLAREYQAIIAKQIDYLGGSPTTEPEPVRTSPSATDMLEFDLENENETIRNYRARVHQCEALGEYAMAEEIREILRVEQEHQIDLATALGRDVPNLIQSGPPRRPKRSPR